MKPHSLRIDQNDFNDIRIAAAKHNMKIGEYLLMCSRYYEQMSGKRNNFTIPLLFYADYAVLKTAWRHQMS